MLQLKYLNIMKEPDAWPLRLLDNHSLFKNFIKVQRNQKESIDIQSLRREKKSATPTNS